MLSLGRQKKIRVKLTKPIAQTEVDNLAAEIDAQLENVGIDHSSLYAIETLTSMKWMGPVEGLTKYVEAYELVIAPYAVTRKCKAPELLIASGVTRKGITPIIIPKRTLETFYGTTEWDNITEDHQNVVLRDWAKQLNAEEYHRTRAYFLNQLMVAPLRGDIVQRDYPADLMINFWKSLGRDGLEGLGASDPYEDGTGIKYVLLNLYSASPFSEPVDWFGYPHPEEFGFSHSNERGYLEESQRQKEYMRKHFERVLGRSIKIEKSNNAFVLREIHGVAPQLGDLNSAF